MYKPKGATGRFAAIAVSGPFGAVKEQVSGRYAQALVERGFLTENGFMAQPFALGGKGAEGLDPAVKYRSCLQNWVIDTGRPRTTQQCISWAFNIKLANLSTCQLFNLTTAYDLLFFPVGKFANRRVAKLASFFSGGV